MTTFAGSSLFGCCWRTTRQRVVAHACLTLLGLHTFGGTARSDSIDTHAQRDKTGREVKDTKARPDAWLTVGVIPTGQVWIDDKPYGYAPVKMVRLKPGAHVVGAGETRARVRHKLTVRAGSEYSLVIDLDAADAARKAKRKTFR